MRAEALVLGGYQENKGKDMTSDKKARGMRTNSHSSQVTRPS